MQYDFQYKITFKLNQPFNINYIKDTCAKYPNAKILIEVQNTKGITSDMLRQLPSDNIAIRIAGGYDEDRVARRKNNKYKNETGQYYTNAVIYTRNETIKILEEIEKIEAGINKNWSSIQKLIYVYDRLKTNVMYDPKFEEKLSSEIRSLRGLITKKTVCAGYAMILKEMMDRSEIDCEYAEGYTTIDRRSAHAWNIININGKKYPIDLTWDNTKFRSGVSKTFDYLGQDIEAFSKCHYPDAGEKTTNYRQTLSQIDPQLIDTIYSQISRERTYSSTTYYGTRNDGSRFVVSQVGDAKINNENFFRYYFSEILPDGTEKAPLLLYSETNLAYLIDSKKFNRPIPPNYEDAVTNFLFSRENIADSLAKRSLYIGKVRKDGNSNKVEVISSVEENKKSVEKINLFARPIKVFRRSDGSVFVVQKMGDKPFQVNGNAILKYDIFEMVNENGKRAPKRNSVFTEKDFISDNRQGIADDYLSRDRLDRLASETGGYIGYYNEYNQRVRNPNLVSYFETTKRIDIDYLKNQQPSNNHVMSIPSFDELKVITSKYKLYTENSPMHNAPQIKIVDKTTGQSQTDISIISKATFANLWLYSVGERDAFEEHVRDLYNLICRQLTVSAKANGCIETVGLFKHIEKYNNYKDNKKIISRLFATPYQTNIIDRIFLEAQGMIKHSHHPKPVALYNMTHASELAYGDGDDAKGISHR